MLKNGTFTEGWTDLPPAPGFLINQQPNHWTLTWLQPGENLYDDPGAQAMGVPECVHKLSHQLPPHEQLGQPNALILAGDTTYKIFHAANTFGATLSQTVTGLEPGSTAVLTVPIQVHMQGASDPFSAESGVWVNGEGGWVNGGEMGDRQWFRHTLTFTVPGTGMAEIVIRVKSKWPQPKDFFIDGITLEATAGEPEEPEEPEEPAAVTRQVIDLLDGSSRNRVILKLREKVGNLVVERGRIARILSGETELEITIKPRPVPKSVGGTALEAAPPTGLNEPAPNSGQRVLGMDVSYAQARTINFENAAAMGVRFCFIRVASGKNEKDENFEHNYREAGRTGMLRGIYYYLYPEAEANVGTAEDRTPEGQARRFAALLPPDAELGAVLDVEDTDLTPGEVRRFVDAFQAADPYNRPIMIYTAAWFWNAARGFSGSAVDWTRNHPLWVAHYTSDTEPIKPSPTFQVAIPTPWPRYSFHQWTAVGGALANQNQVPLDLNYFPGSLTELRAWARQGVQRLVVEDAVGTKFVTSELGLNLREQPTTASNVITMLTLGQRVEVLEEGAWDKIRVDGQTGFASSAFLSTENPLGGGPAAEPFTFKVWPTNHKTVTQRFGERPEFYQQISNGFLPGHEGIDIKAPMGEPYFCVAPGKVVTITDRRADGTASPYGWHIIVQHDDGYSTLYAHATPNFLVKVGDTVAAGQILGHSGNTGNTEAPHLHLTLQKQGHQTPGWPKSYLDPWPFLEPLFNNLQPPMGNLTEGYLFAASMEMRENNLAIAQLNLNMRERPDSSSRLVAKVPPGSVVRLLRTNQENGYLLCEAAVDLEEQPGKVQNFTQPDKIDLLPYVRGNGQQYEVRNAQGGQERFRTEQAGTTFYQVKNAQWEQFLVDNDFIYRDIDTSPGGGRYYRLTDPDRTHGSRWLRRRMATGETYTQARNVQFYNKSDGSPSAANSGNVTDTIKLVARHAQLQLRTGMTINDVIELHWVNGPNDHTPREKYFYGRDFGLVAWERGHQDPHSPAWSALSEIHAPGSRPPIPREVVMIR